MTPQPQGFSCPVTIRYRDVDAMGHVNNAVYVTYLEVARTELWRQRFGFSGGADEFPFVVARIAVDYRAPVHLGDALLVHVAVAAIGRSSFTLAYRLEVGGRLVAEAESVLVAVDAATQKPGPLSSAQRRDLEALAGSDPPR